MDREKAQVLRGFGLDVALWYSLPACFLITYITYLGQPAAAVGPHLLLVTLPFLVLQTSRLLLQRLTNRVRLRQVLTAVVATTLIAILITYYLLVIVGLKSWGGVVARDVIPTFFIQTVVLTDALSVPPWVFPLAGMVLLTGLLVLCWRYLTRFDWLGTATARISAPLLATVTASVAGITALELYHFSIASWTPCGEPLSLTFYPPRDVLNLEGYSVNPVTGTRLDLAEDAARASYRPASGTKKNLVFIVVDALRPDHLGLYGYARPTTPNLSRIAAQQSARMVRGVHSTCADTSCGLYSLFTSKFTSGFSFRPFILHDALRRNGYRIHMILSGDHSYFHRDLKEMYGPVDTFYDGDQATARGYFLNDDALLVDRLAGMPDWDHTPVMFQFHLMSAHILRKSDSIPGPFQPARRYALSNSRDIGPRGDSTPTAVNFYDNGVMHADAILDDLLALLEKKGYLQNTLVVITADHGESLGEHGLYTHANSVREEVLNIPLILIPFGYSEPAYPPAPRFPAQVDIAPTVLRELGVPVPATWIGRDLNSGAGLPLTFFAEHAFAGLIDHRDATHAWKYWIDRKSGVGHIFDLTVDPHENFDLRAAVTPALLAQLRELTAAETSAGLPPR
jgi:glucan phosphoethanolaminetransferase (alkaline phosphatase superfamily)